MSDWSADYSKEYGAELDIFPCDSPSRLFVEYHEKHDLFVFKILHYPEHDPGDRSDFNHQKTQVEVSLCGRNLQALMKFLQKNCQRKNFWAVDSYTNDKECGPMRCARTKGHPGSHMTDVEWEGAQALCPELNGQCTASEAQHKAGLHLTEVRYWNDLPPRS